MGKGSFSKKTLYPLVLVFALVSCGGVDSLVDDDMANGLSSTDGSSSSSVIMQSGSSSSLNVASSSSTNTASGLVMSNSQNCAYTAGSPYGILACTEKTYKTVTIASASSSLTLMAENINIGTMVLAQAEQANDAVIEKYCYDDTESICSTDGGLYQWAEAMSLPSSCNSATCASQISSGHHQGICPTGWHIPKTTEWDALATMLGGSAVAGKTMKLKVTGFFGWDAGIYNDGNSSGFSALPAGHRSLARGYHTSFWEALEGKARGASERELRFDGADFNADVADKTSWLSVRCFKD